MAERILAIDPGPVESAYALIDRATGRPLEFAKVPNETLLDILGRRWGYTDDVAYAVEMVASYGMAVGAEVFDTCVWIGRFVQEMFTYEEPVLLVKRPDVKLHHCHSRGANDSNVRQALVDRFAYGQPNYGKGTKKAPGWFFGFSADVWQAYALAVKVMDDLGGRDG